MKKATAFALGSRKSAAYNSLMNTLNANYNVLCFRLETDFPSIVVAINSILTSGADVVLMPNPYGNPRRLDIYRVLRKIGFPVVVFDRGGLPDSWFFDVGFNADSPSYRPDVWNRPLSYSQNEHIEKVVKHLRDEALPLEAQGRPVGPEALRQKLRLNGRKVLFVPFQRPSDTTVRYFSEPIGSFENFVKLVEEINGRLEKTDKDWTVVAKRHPLESDTPSSALRFADDDTHINDLLAMSDAVLVINSGVGLLAQMWNKPVLIAGTSYYTHESLNKSVRDCDDVLNSLENLPSVDHDVRNRLFHHLVQFIYSFGAFSTERVKQPDGAYRNITRKIEFRSVQLPTIPSKKRLLFATSVIPFPVNRGSALRTDTTLRALLQTGFHIDVLILNQSEAQTSQDELITRLQERYPGVGFIVVEHPDLHIAKTPRDFVNLVKYRIGRLLEKPAAADGALNSLRHNPAQYRQTLKTTLNRCKYDAILFNYLKLIPPRFNAKGARVLTDLHDVQADRIENDVLPKITSFRRQTFLRHALASERHLLKKCDIGICISDGDKNRLRRRYGEVTDLITLPASADAPLRNEPEPKVPLFDFLFVGSNSDPNIDGLCWFLRECWPRITGRLPQATLLVQGGVNKNKTAMCVMASQTDGSVFQSGFVENLSQVYNRARIVVCPVRYGTGMKIKVIEAMSYGKAFVATPAALEGIDLTAGLTAAASAEDFAETCVALRINSKLWNAARNASTETFEKNHTLERYVEGISQILNKL